MVINMKDVQPDNRKLAQRRAVRCMCCAILVALLIIGIPAKTYSQNNGVAPMIAPYNYATPYSNSGYGYAVTPTTGLYYSGNSPMLQPMVTMPHYTGVMSPYSAYPNTAYNSWQYPAYGQQNEHYANDAEPFRQTKQPTGQASDSGYSQYMPIRSPLLETGWETAKLLSPFNAPDGPHRGVGTPLENQSWLDRPWYVGVFGGWVSGSKLISGQIDQGTGNIGGIALGKNLNHYWGLEGRFFGSSIAISDVTDSLMLASDRSSRLTALDLSAHYYPYGEARWRPYFKLGIGYTQQSFTDNYGLGHNINACTVPFGFGLKYWWSDRVNVFGEVVDNIVFGNGPTTTQSDWALNFGVHFTFGSNPNYHPTVYWPQSPAY